jgi:tetratricopeptide (TPR) repeat protein
MSVDAGNRALGQGRWKEAAEAFRAALTQEQSGPALYGLGQALWWLGDMSASLAHLEQACAAFHRIPDPAYAAACALRISLHQRAHLGNPAAAAGWLARAERLIEEQQVDFLRGELFLTKSCVTEDPATGERFARQAIEFAKESGDADLELCGISQLGSWLVEQGRTEEGLALLGEAMAACAGGETANLETVVFTSCSTMVASARCADFTRAVQWVREAERVAKEHAVPFLHAECRAVYASVLFATGLWDRVEEIASEAIAISRGEAPAYHTAALATLAELRLAQGRLEEAERLLAGFEDQVACASRSSARVASAAV